MNKTMQLIAACAALSAMAPADEAGVTTGGTVAAPEAKKKEKTPIEVIDMSDGRKVEFPGKRKLLKETLIDGSKVAVRLDFRNGETRLFTVPDQLLLKAAGHGMEQKLGDETAGEDDVDDMVLAVDELISHLSTTGDWSRAKAAGGMSGTSVLLKALVELSGKTADAVKAFLTGKSQAEKVALRNSPKLKPIVERIEQEKLAKAAKVDTEALLSELA